jgi:hypothetical protein
MLTGKQEPSRNAERTKAPRKPRRRDKQLRSRQSDQERPGRRGAWPTGWECQGGGPEQIAPERDRAPSGGDTLEVHGPRIVASEALSVKKPPKRKSKAKAKAKPPASPLKEEKSPTRTVDEFPTNVPKPTARTISTLPPEAPVSGTPEPWHHRAWRTVVGIFRRT